MVLFLVLFFLLIIFDQACGDCVAWFILGITWFHKFLKKKKKIQTRLILTLFQHQIFFFFFLILTPKKEKKKEKEKKIVNKTKKNKGGYTWLIWWNPISLLALKVGSENQRFKGYSTHNLAKMTIYHYLAKYLAIYYCLWNIQQSTTFLKFEFVNFKFAV